MGYDEVAVAPGVELWSTSATDRPTRVLPDGCVDVLLVEGELLVAGADPIARIVEPGPAALAVRLHGGRAAELLRVRVDELTGRTIPLADLWGDRRAAALADRAAADPHALVEWATEASVDPFGPRLEALLGAGARVGVAAERLALSARQLHRRTLASFGYGPGHLIRVLRLQRMLRLADRGVPWAQCASRSGYADQAHLADDTRALTGLTPTALRRERVRSGQDDAGRRA